MLEASSAVVRPLIWADFAAFFSRRAVETGSETPWPGHRYLQTYNLADRLATGVVPRKSEAREVRDGRLVSPCGKAG